MTETLEWSSDLDLAALQFETRTEFNMVTPFPRDDLSFAEDAVASFPECCFDREDPASPGLQVQYDLEDSRPSSPFEPSFSHVEEDGIRSYAPSDTGSDWTDDVEADARPDSGSQTDGELSHPSTKISKPQTPLEVGKHTKPETAKPSKPKAPKLKLKINCKELSPRPPQLCQTEPASSSTKTFVGVKREKTDSDPESCETETREGKVAKKRGPIIRPQYKCGKCGQMKKGHVCPTVKEEQMIPRVFQMAFVLAAQAVGNNPTHAQVAPQHLQNVPQMVATPPTVATHPHLGLGWSLAFALGGSNGSGILPPNAIIPNFLLTNTDAKTVHNAVASPISAAPASGAST